MAEQTLEEMLGNRVKRAEGKGSWVLGEHGWRLDNYDKLFSTKLYAATAAMMLDDTKTNGKAYFSIRDFKVYVLGLIQANGSAEFFEEEMISIDGNKTYLADEISQISQVKAQLATAAADHSELHGEKFKQAIIHDVRRLDIDMIGGLQLRLAGETIVELAKQAFEHMMNRKKQPYLDRQDRQGEGRAISYKLVR